uniref:Uncharacterized protein n=1 Tax=Tetraselmis sp. GSL018 TaxID=582737 RepID=A0A061RC05_9CHLO
MDGSEAIVLLPKDDRAKAWRSLLKGDQEKGHFEMLKEMVAAEDEVQAYDDIPPESKRLIEEIRERQAMISEGLIDLENGFDDFRIAVGDD